MVCRSQHPGWWDFCTRVILLQVPGERTKHFDPLCGSDRSLRMSIARPAQYEIQRDRAPMTAMLGEAGKCQQL